MAKGEYSKRGVLSVTKRPVTKNQQKAIDALCEQDRKNFDALMRGREFTQDNIRDALSLVNSEDIALYFGPQPRVYPTTQSSLHGEMF